MSLNLALLTNEKIIYLIKSLNKDQHDNYNFLVNSMIVELEKRGVECLIEYKCNQHKVMFAFDSEENCGCPDLELIVNELVDTPPDNEPDIDF